MKLVRILSVIVAGGTLLAFAAPAHAQSRGNRGGGNHFTTTAGRGGFARPGNRGYYYRGRYYPGRYYGGVNFYFGGVYPYGYGYPYPFGYAYYGYPYPYYPYYAYPPQQGVYQGQVVNPPQQTNDGRGKDTSLNSTTARVQQQLAQAGYYHGEVDGVAGDNTRQAIRNYQRDNGLRVDGHIDQQLLSTMGLG